MEDGTGNSTYIEQLEQISRKPIRSICSISLFCRAFRAEKWFPLFLNAL